MSEKKVREARHFYDLGLSAVYAGDYDGAIMAFRQACAIIPRSAASLAGLCLAYHEAGRSYEILAAFEELPALASVDAERLFVMAVALYDAGEYRSACRHARRSLKLCPDSALAHYVHGRILLALRRYSAAARALERILELAPTFKAARSLRLWVSASVSSGAAVRNRWVTQGRRRLHQAPFDLEQLEAVRHISSSGFMTDTEVRR